MSLWEGDKSYTSLNLGKRDFRGVIVIRLGQIHAVNFSNAFSGLWYRTRFGPLLLMKWCMKSNRKREESVFLQGFKRVRGLVG